MSAFAIAAMPVAMALYAAPASADEMDPTLQRFGVETAPGSGVFTPDQPQFARLSSQLGFALAAPLTTPASTTGAKGFYLGFETTVTAIDGDADYWRFGTEGDSEEPNRFVDSSLVASRVHLRKGLPFGIEVGLEGGHFFQTELWVWGADLKIALFEGFREGWPAIIPDVALRGTVRTLTGSDQLQLTVPSFDLLVSKKIVIGSLFELIPIVGVQFFWIFADSEVVDLTPSVDGYAACAPRAPRLDEMGNPVDGADQRPPLECTGSNLDLRNNRSFESVQAFRSRLAIGFTGRYRYLLLGLMFHFDLGSPSAADDVPQNVASQWDVTVSLGSRF